MSFLYLSAKYTTRPGSNITFTVAAYSPSPLRYQWQKNGINITQATNAALLLPNVQFADGAIYTVTATTSLPRVTAIRLEALPDDRLPNTGPGLASRILVHPEVLLG